MEKWPRRIIFDWQMADPLPLLACGILAFTGGEDVRTCTIITCEPNALIASIHNRMPVILPPERCYTWLEDREVEVLQAFLKPLEADRLTFYEVSKAVNRPENDQPEIILPVAR